MAEFQRHEVKSTPASASSVGNGSHRWLQPISRARISQKKLYIYITSQEEEGRAAQKKKEPPSAKTHNPFSHIRPENVCAGCLCCREGWVGVGGVSVYFITLRASALACTCVPDRASLPKQAPLLFPFSSLLSPCFFSLALGQNKGGCFHTGHDCSVLCLSVTAPLLSSPVLSSPLLSSSSHATRLVCVHSPVQ